MGGGEGEWNWSWVFFTWTWLTQPKNLQYLSLLIIVTRLLTGQITSPIYCTIECLFISTSTKYSIVGWICTIHVVESYSACRFLEPCNELESFPKLGFQPHHMFARFLEHHRDAITQHWTVSGRLFRFQLKTTFTNVCSVCMMQMNFVPEWTFTKQGVYNMWQVQHVQVQWTVYSIWYVTAWYEKFLRVFVMSLTIWKCCRNVFDTARTLLVVKRRYPILQTEELRNFDLELRSVSCYRQEISLTNCSSTSRITIDKH